MARVIIPGACSCSPVTRQCVCAPADLGERMLEVTMLKLRADEAEQRGDVDEATTLRAKSHAALSQLNSTLVDRPVEKTNHERTDEMTTTATTQRFWARRAREDGDEQLAKAIDYTVENGHAPRELGAEALAKLLDALARLGALVLSPTERRGMEAPALRGAFKQATMSAGRDLEGLRTDAAIDVAEELTARRRANEKARVHAEWDQQWKSTIGAPVVVGSRPSTHDRADSDSLADRVADEMAKRDRADEEAAVSRTWSTQHLDTLKRGAEAIARLGEKPEPTGAA